MRDRPTGTAALWKQWRTADTQLHRIACISQRETKRPAPEAFVERCRAHAVISKKRDAILKRLLPKVVGLR